MASITYKNYNKQQLQITYEFFRFIMSFIIRILKMDFESGFSFYRIQYSWRLVTLPTISSYLEKIFFF